MNERDLYKDIRIGSEVSIIRCTRSKATNDISVTYEGTGEGLVAAGLVTLRSLIAADKRKNRIDSAGFPFGIQSRWRRVDTGEPYRVYRLTSHRPAARIADLPGASEALAAHDPHEADRIGPRR